MNLLAETISGDTMISGDWMLKLIGAIFTGAALVLGRYWGKKEEAGKLTLQNPLPDFPTRKVSTPPSWDAHRALVDRVTALEHVTQELRRETSQQYHELLKAGGERETHLSDKLDGIARGIHSRIDEILQYAPRPR